jgi:hypothetical protein
MKKILLIIQIIVIACISNNCAKSGSNYYEGYVYAIEKQPIRSLRVYPRDGRYFYCADSGGDIMNEDRFRRAKADSAAGVTDENGYFKFKKAKNWNWSFLMIESEGEIIDSIDIIWSQPWRQRICYVFVSGRADTFFIDMDGKENFYGMSPGYAKGDPCGKRY